MQSQGGEGELANGAIEGETPGKPSHLLDNGSIDNGSKIMDTRY